MGKLVDDIDFLAVKNLAYGKNRNLAAVLGDSLAAALHLDQGTFRNSNARHPLNWANALSGGRIQFVNTNKGNFGVSGERTDQIMTRIPNVIASGAGLVWLIAGTNDIAQNYPTAGTCAQVAATNVISMVNSLIYSGITVILELMIGATNLTTAQLGYMNEFNQRLIEFYLATPSRFLILHDASKMMLNPTNSTTALAFKTGYVYDTTHPSALGAYYWGKSLATVVQAIVPAYPRIGHLNLSDAQRNPFIANGLFSTQTGGTNSIGAALTSGTVPGGWQLSRAGSPTVAISYGTDDGTPTDPSMGSKVILTCTFTATGERIVLNTPDLSTAIWNTGDIISVSARHRLVSGMTNVASIRLRTSVSVDGVGADYHNLLEATGADSVPDEAYTTDQIVGPITIPNGTTKNYLSARSEIVAKAAGTAVVEISRYAMRKLITAP